MVRNWRGKAAILGATALPVLAISATPGIDPGHQADECYDVVLGQWLPTPSGGVLPFLAIPGRLTLSEATGTEGPEAGRTLVRPKQRIEDRTTWAHWHRAEGDTDRTEVAFINDVGVIYLSLYMRSWGWIGDAEATVGDPSSSA